MNEAFPVALVNLLVDEVIHAVFLYSLPSYGYENSRPFQLLYYVTLLARAVLRSLLLFFCIALLGLLVC